MFVRVRWSTPVEWEEGYGNKWKTAEIKKGLRWNPRNIAGVGHDVFEAKPMDWRL